ncbi:hypothetical protein [Thalassotalea maritima]|uniref:hypothetical protein n=1 Tax=Thalassotalea maritima TaxID=3242416 RepID=UPI0035278256
MTCQIEKKRIELTVEQLGNFKAINCLNNHDCKAAFLSQIVGAGLLLPVSAIVSGSIAVVGNTAYWMMEQGECLAKR